MRLRSRVAFSAALRKGRCLRGGAFRCHWMPASHVPCLGLVTGRRVGLAVVRNRLKRMVRDTFCARRASLPDGDWVVVILPAAGTQPISMLRGELTRLFQSAMRARGK